MSRENHRPISTAAPLRVGEAGMTWFVIARTHATRSLGLKSRGLLARMRCCYMYSAAKSRQKSGYVFATHLGFLIHTLGRRNPINANDIAIR